MAAGHAEHVVRRHVEVHQRLARHFDGGLELRRGHFLDAEARRARAPRRAVGAGDDREIRPDDRAPPRRCCARRRTPATVTRMARARAEARRFEHHRLTGVAVDDRQPATRACCTRRSSDSTSTNGSPSGCSASAMLRPTRPAPRSPRGRAGPVSGRLVASNASRLRLRPEPLVQRRHQARHDRRERHGHDRGVHRQRVDVGRQSRRSTARRGRARTRTRRPGTASGRPPAGRRSSSRTRARCRPGSRPCRRRSPTTTTASAPSCSHTSAGSSSMPTETKNSMPNRSRSGITSLSAWCAYSDSLTTRPATKAPSAIDRPKRQAT